MVFGQRRGRLGSIPPTGRSRRAACISRAAPGPPRNTRKWPAFGVYCWRGPPTGPPRRAPVTATSGSGAHDPHDPERVGAPRAPRHPAAFFAERFGIDERVMEELLACALSQGGDYADLYFEHRQTASLLFEEQAVKRASGGVLQGVGVRVVSGDATGYAYTEDFSRDSMRRTAETAARIARSARAPGPLDVTPIGLPNRYPVAQPSIEVRAADKLALLARADRAARAQDPSVARVVVSLADEVRYVVIASSDGRLAGDAQPMLRFSVQCLSERGKSRQSSVS